MPLNIRPNHKRNKSIINITNGDDKNKVDKNMLGNVGNISSLAWLYCDLQNYGKTVIKQGHRDELRNDKPQFWVFCPLLKNKIPHDRILVDDCKNCPHFKGADEPVNVVNKPHDVTSNHKIGYHQINKFHFINFTKEQIDDEIKKLKIKNKKWRKEERKIFDIKQK